MPTSHSKHDLKPYVLTGVLAPHQPMEMAQPAGIWNEYCFKTSSKSKSVLHHKLTHFQSLDSSVSPLFIEEPGVKIYIDLRISTADMPKHDHNLSLMTWSCCATDLDVLMIIWLG